MQGTKWIYFISSHSIKKLSIDISREKKSNFLGKINFNIEMKQKFSTFFKFWNIRIRMQKTKSLIFQMNTPIKICNFRLRPWWKKWSVELKGKMSLNTEVTHYKGDVLELHYQHSDASSENNNFSIEYCSTSLKLSIETLMKKYFEVMTKQVWKSK